MTILRRLRSWIRWNIHSKRLEQSMDQELRDCLDRAVADKIRHGLSPEQARREARMELGGVEQTRERVRAVLSPTALDACVKDVKFAFRTMASNPRSARRTGVLRQTIP